MSNNAYEHPLEVSYRSLKFIKSITLTPREIDIVSCLVSGKGKARTVASFLLIDTRTVEVHTRNIRTKLVCYSQEGILDFIEEAEKISAFRQHYLLLDQDAYFYQKLEKMDKNAVSSSCLVLYDEDTEALIKPFSKALVLLKVETLCQPINKIKYLQDTLSKASFDQCLVLSSMDTQNILPLLKNSKAIISVPFTYYGDREPESDRLELPFEDYYLSVLRIFKKMLPDLSFNSFILDFKKYQNQLKEKQSAFYLDTSQDDPLPKYRPFLKKVLIIILGAMIFVSLLKVSMFYRKKHIFSQGILVPIKQSIPVSIRSDLPLPHESVLLNRSEILKQMHEKLKGQEKIQTLALVGIGGSGKTTLARHYVQTYPAPIVWEINAEDQGSLCNAFKDLASALAQKEDDKKFLKSLEYIKDTKEKERQIIQFVKAQLKAQRSWLLIFDNVEKFLDLQAYFPTTQDLWGKGKVIVTTRDSNIETQPCINHLLRISELKAEEKLALFTKIIKKNQVLSLDEIQTKNAKEFLRHIAPFPLDVSIASYYLKATDVSYNKFLKYFKQQDQTFIKMQEDILKDMSDYRQTRYRLITLSAQHMLQQDKDFHDLLLLISLIDSQDIPLDLLYAYKNHATVDNFIHYLKKYSLITHLIKDNHKNLNAFSIHRSTQEILKNYLLQSFNIDVNKKIIKDIALKLKDYIVLINNKENFMMMKNISRSYISFLQHSNLLDKKLETSLGIEIATIYYYMAKYQNALEYFKRLQKKLPIESQDLVRLLLNLGNVYWELGDYNAAEDYFIQCLKIYNTCLTSDYKGIIQANARLGMIYRYKGQIEKAKEFLEKSFAIHNQHFLEKYDSEVALWALAQLGIVYKEQGNYIKAQALLTKSLSYYKTFFPENELRIAWNLVHLANIERIIGNYEYAQSLLKESLAMHQKLYGEDHIDYAWILTYFAHLHEDMGNFDLARKKLERSLAIKKQFFPENNLKVMTTLLRLGNVYGKEGHFDQALALLLKVLDFYKKLFEEDRFETAYVLRDIGYLYQQQNQLDTARLYYNKARNIFEKNSHSDVALIHEDLGDLLLKESNILFHKRSIKQAEILIQKAKSEFLIALQIGQLSYPKGCFIMKRIHRKSEITKTVLFKNIQKMSQ